MTIFYFLESYRLLVCLTAQKFLDELPDRYDSIPRFLRLAVEESLERDQVEMMSEYNVDTLYFTHQVFCLLIMVFYDRLRPPTPGQKSLKRKEAAKLLIFGGLREVGRMMRFPSYRERRLKLDSFLMKLDRQPVDPWDGAPTELPPGLLKQERTSPPISLTETSRVMPLLPKLSSIWTPAALQKILMEGILDDLNMIPSMEEFLFDLIDEKTR
ncbi:MAG: hypothetical protein M1834_008674 [Cirrosporium novae-zelandiae]|nr:MAG: hypothetical protein M1834_008674 [Cirrosporium novae-zelandiae]